MAGTLQSSAGRVGPLISCPPRSAVCMSCPLSAGSGWAIGGPCLPKAGGEKDFPGNQVRAGQEKVAGQGAWRGGWSEAGWGCTSKMIPGFLDAPRGTPGFGVCGGAGSGDRPLASPSPGNRVCRATWCHLGLGVVACTACPGSQWWLIHLLGAVSWPPSKGWGHLGRTCGLERWGVGLRQRRAQGGP